MSCGVWHLLVNPLFLPTNKDLIATIMIASKNWMARGVSVEFQVPTIQKASITGHASVNVGATAQERLPLVLFENPCIGKFRPTARAWKKTPANN